MNDASEVLAEIFDCLHKAFMPSNMISEKKCDRDAGIGSWDCQNKSCIVHSIFGLDISEQMNCQYCRLESRYLKYTSFFHNINANALRTMKVTPIGHGKTCSRQPLAAFLLFSPFTLKFRQQVHLC